MLFRLIALALAVASSITAFNPIPCGCDAALAASEKCRDSSWCGIECLRYLREDERIMDLVHCRESTCDEVVDEVEVVEVGRRESVEVRTGSTCTCHCKNARQVSWEKQGKEGNG